ALIAGLGFTGPITVFFTALWLIAAWLFQRAGRGASKRIVQKDPPSAR
nr:hypothetical protein [Sphingomonas sp.]